MHSMHTYLLGDHIIVMPAPVTNLRHQTSMRGFFHYMMQLNPPIFLNVEFSKSFVKAYPYRSLIIRVVNCNVYLMIAGVPCVWIG